MTVRNGTWLAWKWWSQCFPRTAQLDSGIAAISTNVAVAPKKSSNLVEPIYFHQITRNSSVNCLNLLNNFVIIAVIYIKNGSSNSREAALD